MLSGEAESSTSSSSKSDLLPFTGWGWGGGRSGQLLSSKSVLRDLWIQTFECHMLPHPTSQGPTLS